MYVSKRMLIRAAIIISIGVVVWSVWKRIDGIVDQYHTQYLLHQGEAMVHRAFREDDQQFDQQFNKMTQSIDSDSRQFAANYSGDVGLEEKPLPGRNQPQSAVPQSTAPSTSSPQSDARNTRAMPNTEAAKDKKYEDRAIFKPTDNMPVPRRAEEATAGMYQGLINLLFGRFYIVWYVALAGSFLFMSLYFTRRLLRRVDAIMAARSLS